MKTVFIIGAGASQEAKLPTGSDLMDWIIRALSIEVNRGQIVKGDARIFDALSIVLRNGHPYSNDMSPFRNAAQHICRAIRQTTSIDRFIDSQSGTKRLNYVGNSQLLERSWMQRPRVMCLLVSVSMVGKQSLAFVKTPGFTGFSNF